MQGIWQNKLWLLALPHIVTILELVLEFILLTSYFFISWQMFGVCFGDCMSIGNALLYYVLLLCRIMDISYCTAMTLMSSKIRISNVVSIFSIEGVCVAAMAPAMMTTSGSTFHSMLIILYMNSWFIFF